VDLVKYYTSWKIRRILETMTGNVVISERDALVYVVLSKEEKHVPYGELVCSTECIMLKTRCCTDRSR
jgi:hypothetical protein